jgi:hypothetical protein
MSFLGLRFTGLALPTDAIIVSATMDVVSSQDQMAKINAVIFGERSAAPEEFSLSNPPARRQLTRTRIQLQGDNRWQRDVTYGFDVTDVVKELYTTIRPTDKIALIVAGRGDRNQKTYIFNSLAPDYSPTLTITYTLPEAYVTPTPIVDETILDVLMAPLRAKKPTPTQPPAPTPTSEPTPTPYQYVKPTPTPCPYPPDDPRCGASDQPTPITEPYVPLQSQVTPTPCPYPPDDPRCGY